MSDEDTGALSNEGEGTEESGSKTLTVEEATKLANEAAAKATKEAESKAYRRFQSDLDKERAKSKKAQSQLDELERKTIDNLPEDQKRDAMLQKVYEHLTSPSSSQDDDDGAEDATSESNDSGTEPDDRVAAAQAKVKQIAKDNGLDPEKLDFSDPEKFIKEILSQAKKSDGDDEDDETEDDSAGGPVDAGTGSVGSAGRDLTKVDPIELMKKGYAKGPVRRRRN